MGRNKKIEIPEEELTALDNNEVSPKELAEKHNTQRSYFDNIKHKRKLKTQMSFKPADQNLENNQSNNTNQMKAQVREDTEPVIDYHTAVLGLYTGCDAVFNIIASLSKGQIEYKKCEDQELEKLTQITENDPVIRKASTFGGISTLVTAGAIMSTFGTKFKVKKKIKHNAKDKNCMCESCIKVREFLAKTTKSEEKKEESVKDRIDQLNEKNSTGSKIQTNNDDRPIEKKLEHENDGLTRLPSGAIIQENKPSNISPDEVIRQNTGAK